MPKFIAKVYNIKTGKSYGDPKSTITLECGKLGKQILSDLSEISQSEDDYIEVSYARVARV